MKNRRCIVLVGPALQTRQEAAALLVDIPPESVLWVGAGGVAPSAVCRLLGVSKDAVVLSLHGGLSADVLAQCAGFVRGGGALILCRPVEAVPAAGMVVEPFSPSDVTTRLWQRIAAHFPPTPDPIPLPGIEKTGTGSAEQAGVVAAIRTRLTSQTPWLISLTADRGRGKSSALGLAIAGLDRSVVVCADRPLAAAEVFRFATGSPEPPREGALCYRDPTSVVAGVDADIILVDEAARLSVPVLEAIVRSNPDASIVFSTTIRGYEGTGRGFLLRFVAGLEAHPRPLLRVVLEEPIRWRSGDPLEGRIFEALALNAEPAASVGDGEAKHVVLSREHIAADPQCLADFFGLLVHAHYRTTPEDLHRILDAPNLTLHAMMKGGRVVVASMVASEGGLSPQRCDWIARGAGRIRGHALPDTLISHAGQTAAGQLRMIRSVRIATHPDFRRQGLARRLVDAVHAHHRPDLFGTLFGATPSVLRFRRRMGYQLVRVGAARGSRTGEPTAIMIRPISPDAETLVTVLRQDLARELPGLLTLMAAEGPLDHRLQQSLAEELPPVQPLSDGQRTARISSYLRGPCHFESAAFALQQTVGSLMVLSEPEQRLVRGKVMEHRAWRSVAQEAGLTVPGTQRALKRALRTLLES